MKLSKISLLTALLGTLVAWAPFTNAQDNAGAAKTERPAAGQRERRGGAAGANQFDRMAERLKLTDDQKAKLQPIVKEETAKIRELREDTSLTPEQRRDKVREVREQYLAKMKPILTTEQAEQLKKMREQTPGRAQRGPRATGERPAGGDEKKDK